MEMRKILAVAILALVLLATVALTGCVDDNTITGTVYNRTEYKMELRVRSTTGTHGSTVSMAKNHSKEMELLPGSYIATGTLTVGTDDAVFVDSQGFQLLVTDTTFDIYVDEDSITITTT